MRYQVLDGEAVCNTIEAAADFMAAAFPAGNYRAVVEAVAESPRWYSMLEFYRLFGIKKHAAIAHAAKSDPLIEVFLMWLEAAGGCYLSHPDTAQGVNYLALVGLITHDEAGRVLAGVGL